MNRQLLICAMASLAASAAASSDETPIDCNEYSLSKSWNHFADDYYSGMSELAVDVRAWFDVRCVNDDFVKPEREEFMGSQMEAQLREKGGYAIVSTRDAKTIAALEIHVDAIGRSLDPSQCLVRYTLRLGFGHTTAPPWGGPPRYGFNEIARHEGFGLMPPVCVENAVGESVDESVKFLNWLPSSGEQEYLGVRRENERQD